MKVENIFQMNDWEINKLLKFVVFMQSLFIALFVLDGLGIHFLILREAVTFICLLFIPGILILRILKIHELSNIETLLYSVGLSISSIFLVGFVMNFIYPLFGIKPIEIVPLTITMTVFSGILSIISYMRDRNFYNTTFIDNDLLVSPIFLFLCVIPFLAIFGTYLMNFYKINLILVFLIIIIGSILILVMFNKIPKKLYPFTIFIVSISLLYQISLMSNYVSGNDIQLEYYSANMVIKNAYWDFQVNSLLTPMLSVTIFPAIYSIMSKMDLIWTYKLIYPFIFSLVPLGLYQIIKKQTNSKIAFLSSFFFVSFYIFYMEMPSLARQEIGELFVILILLILLSKMDKFKAGILYLIFGISLMCSHYSLIYLYLIMIMFVMILRSETISNLLKPSGKVSIIEDDLFGCIHQKTISELMEVEDDLLTNTPQTKKLLKTICNSFKIEDDLFGGIHQKTIPELLKVEDDLLTSIPQIKKISKSLEIDVDFLTIISKTIPELLKNLGNYTQFKNDLLTVKFLIPLILFTVIYYAVIGSSIELQVCLGALYQTWIGITHGNSFLSMTPQGLQLIIMGGETPIHQILKYLHIIAQLFIAVGLIELLRKPNKFKFKKEFVMFAVVILIILILAIFLPAISAILNTTRLYQIALIFLAPLAILGGFTVIKFLVRFIDRSSDISNINKNTWRLFTLFLVIFFAFNSGLVDAVEGSGCNSIALNSTVYTNMFNSMEYYGGDWLYNYAPLNHTWEFSKKDSVFSDSYRRSLLTNYGFRSQEFAFNSSNINFTVDSTYNDPKSFGKYLKANYSSPLYLYLGTKNTEENTALTVFNQTTLRYVSLGNFLDDENKIYNNKGSQIYYI